MLLAFLEYTKKREEVQQRRVELTAKAQEVVDIITNPDVLQNLKQDTQQNLDYLKEAHNVR